MRIHVEPRIGTGYTWMGRAVSGD